MLCVSHPIADLINDGLVINNKLDLLKIIKDENNGCCLDYDEECRRFDLEENNEIYVKNHLN